MSSLVDPGINVLHENEVVQEVRRVLVLEGQALLAYAERLVEESVVREWQTALGLLSEALDRGGKIIVTGVGKSGKIGQKIAATLCSTGSLAVYVHPTEGLHGDLGLIRPEDVVVALSYTGNTEEVVRLMPSFRSLKIPVIGIGGNSQSKLAQQCDVWIGAPVEAEACPYNLAPTTSTTLTLAIGDALAVTLMRLRRFDAVGFARNHPGGSLGRKLRLTVEDLMHSGEAVGVLSSEANMEEVVGLATEKKLGAVLVAEGSRLLGLITDGDIRRALRHREKFFTLKAGDIMTSRPVTILPGMKAENALVLMEDRPSQIAVLPVVDEKGHWKGLLRLHDLIRSF